MGDEAGRLFWPGVRTGVVCTLAPLSVRAGDVTLDASELLIDPRLLPRAREISADQLEGAADFLAPLGAGAAFSNGSAAMTAKLPGELAAGDRVAMVSSDGEIFIIICKAVGV